MLLSYYYLVHAIDLTFYVKAKIFRDAERPAIPAMFLRQVYLWNSSFRS